MIIDQARPEVVGGRASLPARIKAEGAQAGCSVAEIDGLLSELPPRLLSAECFLDLQTGLWRYEFCDPYTIRGDYQLLGTNIWLPVKHLLAVLRSAKMRLSDEERARYFDRLADPRNHEASLVEFIPVLRVADEVNTVFEFCTGVGNRNVDWRLSSGKGPAVLLDVKRRSRDLLDTMERVLLGERDPDGGAPAPQHDPAILFRSVTDKLPPSNPDVQLQGAWIVTDLAQEVDAVRVAFDSLDSQRVHFAVLGGWEPGIALLTRRESDSAFLLNLFQETGSDRHFFSRPSG